MPRTTKETTMTTIMFGFEIFDATLQSRHCDGWTTVGCGDQNASNYLLSREAAEAQLTGLANLLVCDVAELRVVAVEVAT